MFGFYGGPHAAARKRRRMLEEEEEEERMTRYSSDDLNEDWEFKIVRSETAEFRKAEVFQQLLQEEAISGWRLVEKLDDMRIRFKRPASARKRDAMLPEGIDPYRTRFGSSSRSIILVFLLLGVTAVLSAGVLPLFTQSNDTTVSLVVGIGIVFTLVAVISLMIVRMRRR